MDQSEIRPGWCTVGVRLPHTWRPRSASLGPGDAVGPLVGRDFLELSIYGGDEEAEILIAEGIGYEDRDSFRRRGKPARPPSRMRRPGRCRGLQSRRLLPQLKPWRYLTCRPTNWVPQLTRSGQHVRRPINEDKSRPPGVPVAAGTASR